VKGRKRQLVVDTLGLLWAVAVHPADIQDTPGSWRVLRQLPGHVPRLQVILADDTYRGARIVVHALGWRLEIGPRVRGRKGFHPEPKRWIVERTFAWLGKCRRLSKDYEALTRSGEAWIYLAMSRLMLLRLAR
jgi:transposase